MAVEAAEATESLPKDTGLVGLDGPLEELDLTNMLVKNFEEEEEEEGPEETLLSGAAVEEAEPVEESTEEAVRTLPSSAPSGRPGYLCLNGQRVWKTNSMMEELTVAKRSRLAKC